MQTQAQIKEKPFLLKIPSLLIAMPQLEDPRFNQSVVCLISHSVEGGLGLVINSKSDLYLSDIEIPERKIHKSLLDVPVWYGGPCEPNRIWLMHKNSEAADEHSLSLSKDIFLSSAFDAITTNNEAPFLKPEEFKVISGYAGWGAGQLEQEIESSAWLVAPFSPSLAFETPSKKIWTKSLEILNIDPSQLTSRPSFDLH